MKATPANFWCPSLFLRPYSVRSYVGVALTPPPAPAPRRMGFPRGVRMFTASSPVTEETVRKTSAFCRSSHKQEARFHVLLFTRRSHTTQRTGLHVRMPAGYLQRLRRCNNFQAHIASVMGVEHSVERAQNALLQKRGSLGILSLCMARACNNGHTFSTKMRTRSFPSARAVRCPTDTLPHDVCGCMCSMKGDRRLIPQQTKRNANLRLPSEGQALLFGQLGCFLLELRWQDGGTPTCNALCRGGTDLRTALAFIRGASG